MTSAERKLLLLVAKAVSFVGRTDEIVKMKEQIWELVAEIEKDASPTELSGPSYGTPTVWVDQRGVEIPKRKR